MLADEGKSFGLLQRFIHLFHGGEEDAEDEGEEEEDDVWNWQREILTTLIFYIILIYTDLNISWK